MTSKELAHKPVLINEIIKLTGPKDNETYFDEHLEMEDTRKNFLSSLTAILLQLTGIRLLIKLLENLKKNMARGSIFSILNLVKLTKLWKKPRKKKLTVSYLI